MSGPDFVSAGAFWYPGSRMHSSNKLQASKDRKPAAMLRECPSSLPAAALTRSYNFHNMRKKKKNNRYK